MKLVALDALAPRDLLSARSVLCTTLPRSAIVFGGAAALVGGLGLMHGGYFSTAWGWGAVACLWAVVAVLVISDRVWIGSREIMLLAGLAAFLMFVAASASWSVAPGASVREVERGILLLAALAIAMLLARRRMRPLLAGVAVGITVAASYGLATRLFPTRLGSFDPVAGYRLAEPLGYWNALGILASIGALISFGFAARARTVVARALGSAA